MAQKSAAFEDKISSPLLRSFYKNGSVVLNKILSPVQRSTPLAERRTIGRPANQNCLIKYTLNTAALKPEPCKCPHVLVADDDPFQHFYYQSLFQKSLDFEGVMISRQELRIKFCYSGEELSQKVDAIKKCRCNNLILLITDYNMGDEKLNGISTSVKVRDIGYKGPLLLRTGDSKESLMSAHEELDSLLENKTIDAVIDKGDLKGGKQLIQACLRESSKNLVKNGKPSL